MKDILFLCNPAPTFKRIPLDELYAQLRQRGFNIVESTSVDDLLDLVRNNAQVAGVVFDWDSYSLDLNRPGNPGD